MESNSQKKEENKIEETKTKKNFFNKIWYSIYKIEKYSELSAEGFMSAIRYLIGLVIIISMMSGVVTVYRASKEINSGVKYIKESAPEFIYKDGELSVETQETIRDENTVLGKVIIDTKVENEEKIKEYLNEINDEQDAVVILKDKMMIKQEEFNGIVSYNYKDLFNQIGISEFNKKSLIEYLSGKNMINMYFNMFLVLFVYSFVIQFVNILPYIMLISIFGYITTLILKMRIRYVAIFNMAVYAITLPVLLNILYIGINAFIDYTIKYFDIMYILVASIYIISAIFILKSEFNKKQGEVLKVIEVEKKIKEENKEVKDDKENKNEEKNEKKDNQEDNKEGNEQEGANA